MLFNQKNWKNEENIIFRDRFREKRDRKIKERYRIRMQIWLPEIFSKIIIFSHNYLIYINDGTLCSGNKNVY
jgi:hypothetical protein